MKKAVIYLRVSTGQQAEKELPLESQEHQCRQKAQELGAEVVHVFSDKGISGRTDSRPEFQYAISHCEIFDIDYFITWSTSRFSRSAVDAKLYKKRLDKAGTKVCYASQNIDRDDEYGGFLQESILELFDEMYSKQVSADTRRSMVRNAQSGFWKGGRPPFGYKAIKAPENPKRTKLVPDEIEQPIAEEIFNLRVIGHGSKLIAEKLNSNNKLRRGSKWSKSAVASVLRNEHLIGKTIFGRKNSDKVERPRNQWIIVDSHEPIIDEAVFNQVQGLMDEASNIGGSAKSTWLFTGLVRCQHCGLAMRIESAKGRNQRYYYYNCAGAQKGLGCENRRLPAELLDEWLVDEICRNLFSEQLLKSAIMEMNEFYGDWAKDRQARRAAVTTELGRWKKKQNKLYSILEESDDFDFSDLSPRIKQNKEEIRRLEAQIVEIDLEEPPRLEIHDHEITELRDDLIATIKGFDEAKKARAFFGNFIEKVIIKDDNAEIFYRPDSLIPETTQRVVPSTRNWLPKQNPLGTNCTRNKRSKLSVYLPPRLAKAA